MFQAGVEMNVTAPFFNDPKPDGPSGQPFYGLWDYEGEFLRPPRVVRGALLASPFLCFPSFASSVSGGMPLILIFSFSFSFGMFSRSYYSLFPFVFIDFFPPIFAVVEMFFLNDNDEYLEVELGPWGQHLLLLLKGARNAIKHSMPLDYIAQVPTTTDVSKSQTRKSVIVIT